MAIQLGGLLGAATNLTTALSREKTLKSFLETINDYGLQVANNFEVNFSGLQDITFFVESITLPGLRQNMTELYYDGRKVDVPINIEYDHEWTASILNDAQGYIYTAISEFIISEEKNTLVKSGFTMTIKALTGDSKYKGSLITCRGVRVESIDGLNFGQASNDIQKFSIKGRMQDFTYTPGILGLPAGILGTVNSLIG